MGSLSAAPLIVIVGETASGKTTLALETARKLNGEIICADSRTVYRGMDIGTAKPTSEEQAIVTHHLLDIINPDQKFTVGDFKTYVLQAIDDITARGKVPIMVGGTGLYIDSILFNYQFSNPGAERSEQNPRHLKSSEPRTQEMRPGTLVIGLSVPREELSSRISQRVRNMVEQGLEGEARRLSSQYGWEVKSMDTIGYQEWHPYFDREQDLETTIQRIEQATRAYAKRQRTWFKRNKSIQWFEDPQQAVNLATQFVKKYNSFS